MPVAGRSGWRFPPRIKSPSPSKTERTSSHSPLRQKADEPGSSSKTEREIAEEPSSLPTCRQTESPSRRVWGAPSRSPKTRQPPGSSIGIAWLANLYPSRIELLRFGSMLRDVSDPKARVDAKNQDFIRFEQVEKKQEYRLAEAEEAEQFDSTFRIRTCDLGKFLLGGESDRRAFARELGEALEEIGFAILEGHGVDPRLYEEAEARTPDVFLRPTLEEKLRYRAERHGSVNQGYFPIKETSDIHPDLVEGWVFCRRAFDLPDRGTDSDERYDAKKYWPIEDAEPFFRRLCQAHEKLILPVMQSMLQYLGSDPHRYDRKLTGTNFGLRLNYYPPVRAE